MVHIMKGNPGPKSQHLSATQVVALCIFCFFLGRFLQLPGMPDGAGKGLQVVHTDRKMLIETTGKQPVIEQQQPNLASLKSFEEVIEASGLLKNKPPVPAGATGNDYYITQPFQILSWHPRAYLYPNFMDREKCNHVIEMAKKRLAPSGLAFKNGDTAENTRDVRTSEGTFISSSEDAAGILSWVERKIAALTMIPVAHGEPFNVLRYENGQHYDSHYDSFDESSYGRQASNRIATVLVYLSDVEEGGETSFLFEGQGGLAHLATVDYKKCDTGIKYKPRAGDALLFWSAHLNGTTDKHALHGGCPVRSGFKLRDQCMSGGADCMG